MSDFRRTVPGWFRIAAIVLILWGLIGVFAWVQQIRLGAEAMGPATDYDRALFAALPGWYAPVYAAAVFCGLAGAAALLLRSRLALALSAISLIAVIVMFGWMFVATDLIAHKGVLVATGFPIFIALVALYQLWLANRAARSGWVR